MIRYRLEPSDVSAVRFGISPLSELGLALRAFRAPERYPLQRPWIDRIAGVLPLLDREVLTELVDERLWVADFVNPRPESPLTSFDDELRALGQIRPERLQGDLERVHGTVPPVFAGRHDSIIERLQQALATTWELCFAPYWLRMRRVLQADVAHRGRIATHQGVGAVLTGLSDGVRFDGRYVDVRLSKPDVHERPVRGEGLTLVPSMFVARASAPVDDDLPPTVMYPARGQGAMWSTASHPDAGAVRGLLGRTRAALLEALGEPASSTDLAMRFGVSTSAVNQHLRMMERGGLLNRTRYGRAVLYYRSTVGDALTRTE
ncbi:ArsR/SmtB family transcription factor [Curtobacterium sp. RIT-PI-V]|uniref:ArsR/SmtB family transcription factor n=1 Tax=Curtobacterium sp. RIT-PI-V TaxID=3035296 RepID=UPI0021D8752E|nr:winged helix-turn-helix domain-containing protein [Curtobacterium sp. RIT-PI-V]